MARKPTKQSERQKSARAASALLKMVRDRDRLARSDNPVGRPPILQSVDDLYTRTDDYLDWCFEHDQPMTMAGLQLFLGIHRNGWGDYTTKPEFRDAITDVRQIVIAAYEGRLDRDRCTGAIFALKNLAGWRDRREATLEQWLRKLGISGESLDTAPNHIVQRVAAGDIVALFEWAKIEPPERTADGYLPPAPTDPNEIVQPS